MDGEKRGVGVGELMFGVVIMLAVAGIVPLFLADEALGDSKPAVIIVTSLAFIGSFAALSVYGRAKKRKHTHRYGLQKSLKDWLASSAAPGAASGPAPTLQTVENIAAHLYRANGYRLGRGSTGGRLRLDHPGGQVELVQCHVGEQPLGLREVVTFYEILRAEKAAHGEIWSVSGFSPEATQWTSRKPISLLDAGAIHVVVKGLIQGTGR